LHDGRGRATGRPGRIRLEGASLLDDRLRGRTLREDLAEALPALPPGIDGLVLATGPNGDVWRATSSTGGVRHDVACAPDELQAGERLKSRLRAGSFLALLPIVQFLRNLSAPVWDRPPPRACFLFDDANLHWASYGYLRYEQLAAHADEHGYCADIAMIPLDGWYAHPSALSCFRRTPRLSLLVHGNNHTKDELEQPVSEDAAVRVAASALKRISAFESRTGLQVARVMSPPHGSVSLAMMSALRRTGFEAIAYWGPGDVASQALVDWGPADVHLGGGFPGLNRIAIDTPLDELVLRTFLGQRLLLSGHHADLSDGLDGLREAVARVDQLGPVEWSSVEDVARTNFAMRHDDGVVRVRPFTRRFLLDPPPHAERLVVEWPGDHDDVGAVVVTGVRGAPTIARAGDDIELPAGTPLDVRLVSDDTVDLEPVTTRSWAPWPVVRRCLTEGRDRMMPLIRPATPARTASAPLEDLP
ncbi:MAG: hypothetical protein M3163_02975, partial [Actinomycetota bacterium]|nr:hypothetical protein [Actinomycetota bacterium]